MYLRKFRKTYGLDLLPVAHSQIMLGDLVWKSMYRRAKMVRRGLPGHLYNVFNQLQIWTKYRWRKEMKELKASPFIEGHFANHQIAAHFDFLSDFAHPLFRLINHSYVDLEKIDFSFDYIQVKLMDNEVRLKIQEELEEIPARVEKEYFGRLQRVHIITELYYGKIHLKTNRETAHHLNTLVKNSSIKGVVKLHKDKTWHYIFDHHDVPFAMRIEPIDEFKA